MLREHGGGTSKSHARNLKEGFPKEVTPGLSQKIPQGASKPKGGECEMTAHGEGEGWPARKAGNQSRTASGAWLRPGNVAYRESHGEPLKDSK